MGGYTHVHPAFALTIAALQLRPMLRVGALGCGCCCRRLRPSCLLLLTRSVQATASTALPFLPRFLGLLSTGGPCRIYQVEQLSPVSGYHSSKPPCRWHALLGFRSRGMTLAEVWGTTRALCERCRRLHVTM